MGELSAVVVAGEAAVVGELPLELLLLLPHAASARAARPAIANVRTNELRMGISPG